MFFFSAIISYYYFFPYFPPPPFFCQIGECRSSTHVDGGKNPVWQNLNKNVFTFYVPATVTLERLTLALEVINDNFIADSYIGTTGSIAVAQVRTSIT